MRANQFFAMFSPAGVERLAAAAQRLHLPAGTILFDEGDVPDSVYLVDAGAVDLVKRDDAGGLVVLARATAGDYFGELAVLADGRRTTGARTQTAVELARIDRAAVLAVLQDELPSVTMQLFKRVMGYLHATNEKFTREVLNKERLHVIGEMASALIHDFRSPLTSIQLAGQLLGRQHLDESSQRWCRVIHDETERMVEMAQDLLDYSRGRPELRWSAVTVADLLERFRDLNQDYLDKAGVSLSVQSEPLAVRLDVNRMLRVLQNLVSNAVDALGGRPDPQIELTARPEADGLMIRVADNGPGIPEVIRARVFEPFVTHGKAHGTGLGMAIARSVIEAHQGSISFTTETGRGTTFAIWLPAPSGP